MHFSALFIRRPVATTLLTAGLALLGLSAFFQLPSAAMPQVEYPVLSVQASLPGASPEVMAATVATPLERRLGTIAGVNEITSSSSQGSTQIALQFELSRDLDGAARDVQAAINAARAELPSGMPSNPSWYKANPNDTPIFILALTSDTLSRVQMYDAAATLLSQQLAQVAGVGQVEIGGSSLPAIRVALEPRQLAQVGLGPEDVRRTITNANVNRPKGALSAGDQRWEIAANDQALAASDYPPLILSWRDGAAVRLKDVATVSDGAQDIRNAGFVDGQPAVTLMIRRQPGANVIATVDRIRAILPQLQASIPKAITLSVAQDRSTTIRTSLRDVGISLGLAVLLVILVIFVFLRDRRAAWVPAIVVPVSLAGGIVVMYLCGFSLNNLSLMALIAATGLIADDAVVVIENITRHIERGLTPLAAALHGVREVGFTLLVMTLSLVAVFIPIIFMDGIVGRLFREFAITLAATLGISLLVSLCITPMLCSRLLRPLASDKPVTDRLEGLYKLYRRSLAWTLDHGSLALLTLAGIVSLTIWLYIVIPKGFFPQQDTGRIRASVQLDQSTSFQAMERKLADITAIIHRDPAVANVVGNASGGQRNGATLFVSLKPRDERGASSEDVINRLRKPLSRVPGANVFMQPVQEIRIGARPSSAAFQYTLLADDLATLRTWEPRIRQALAELPGLEDVNTDQQDKGLQTSLVTDRNAAARLGLSQRSINTALNDYFGQRPVSTLYRPLNQYRVVMEAAPRYWQSPSALAEITLPGAKGEPVPLSAIAHWEPAFAPLSVSHQSQFLASTVSFGLAKGTSLGEATARIKQAMLDLGVPISIQGSFEGTARAFQASMANQPLLILAALLTVYLVLGILYESLLHPATILSCLPPAGVGALLALKAFHTEFTVIALIGVMLLVGMVMRNAILMVDFALQVERSRKLSAREAIFTACLLRFRPIIMTTLAALFGAIPLALGSGDGSELRQPLGMTIVGGLILSQWLTLYITPVVYLGLDRLRRPAPQKQTQATPTQTVLQAESL